MIIKAARHFRKRDICPYGLIKVDANLKLLVFKGRKQSGRETCSKFLFCYCKQNHGLFGKVLDFEYLQATFEQSTFEKSNWTGLNSSH